MNQSQYVTAVLTAYLALPDTTCRPRRADRALAHQLFTDAVPLPLVLDALRLAHARRHLHPGASPQPVRSLHYFLPVIRELSTVDPAALTWLRDALHRRLSSPTDNPAQPPIATPTT